MLDPIVSVFLHKFTTDHTSKEIDEQTCEANNTVLNGECSFFDEVIALSDPNYKLDVQNRRQDLINVDSDID